MNKNPKIHPFPRIFDKHSKVLIVGLFPSKDSQQGKFYYNHSRNRFWKIMGQIFGKKNCRVTIKNKRKFALDKHIAFCDIIKINSDKIDDIEPNNFYDILQVAQIKQIFVIGNKASRLVKRYYPRLEFKKLISSSNLTYIRGYDTPKLIEQYKAIRDVLES